MPLTLILTTLILTVSSGITTIVIKELFFSRLSRDSDLAYYAADAALECASFLNDTYVNSDGSGLFENPVNDATATLTYINLKRQSESVPPLALTDIRCASVPIFDSTVTNFAVTNSLKSDGITPSKLSTFSMQMDIGEGKTRCAIVTVNKTTSWTQIIARGFNTCSITGKNVVERAVVGTSEN
jgi:hypothetical protein